MFAPVLGQEPCREPGLAQPRGRASQVTPSALQRARAISGAQKSHYHSRLLRLNKLPAISHTGRASCIGSRKAGGVRGCAEHGGAAGALPAAGCPAVAPGLQHLCAPNPGCCRAGPAHRPAEVRDSCYRQEAKAPEGNWSPVAAPVKG